MTIEDISFHAEILPRINRLNVTVEGQDVNVRILDQRTLELSRGELRKVIRVPGQLRTDQSVDFEANSRTARLQLDSSNAHGEVAPWSASSMGPNTQISCKQCQATFLDCKTIQQWKDLPSEGWEEMMEFWHCHRPNNGTTSHYSSVKSGQFHAQPGVCLISAAQFIFSSRDISISKDSDSYARCNKCNEVMGVCADEDVRIAKRAVCVTLSNKSVSYNAEYFITSKILAFSEMRSGHRCCIPLKPMNLLIWIFASDIFFVNSVVTRPSKGLKLLYRYVEPSTMSNSASGLEILDIDEYEHHELFRLLKCSTRDLPKSLRRFGDFNVGYLRCF